MATQHDILIANMACPKHTVDGRNPPPVDMENIPFFIRFSKEQVVQDFFHQQYQTPWGFFGKDRGSVIVTAAPVKKVLPGCNHHIHPEPAEVP